MQVKSVQWIICPHIASTYHIYFNFMESAISGIEIWLNLWVSATNELGKHYFWQSLLKIDPLR